MQAPPWKSQARLETKERTVATGRRPQIMQVPIIEQSAAWCVWWNETGTSMQFKKGINVIMPYRRNTLVGLQLELAH